MRPDTRRRVKRALYLIGLERVNHRLHSQSLEHLMPAAEVRHVVDVGANIGQFAHRVRAEGFRGRIDSFEPVAASYAQLAAGFEGDDAWFGHHAAASSESGSVTMNLYSSSELNSMAKTTAAGAASFSAYQDFHPTGSERTAAVILDDAGLPDAGAVFLKVDTQGHDWEVMAGAAKLLERTVLLSMELSFVALYDTAVPAWESIRRLEELGFGLAAIDTTVSPADDPLLIGEADGVFLRRTRPLGGA